MELEQLPHTISRFIHPTTSGCWEWHGTQFNGYGRHVIAGRKYYVHRTVWELAHQPLTDGQCIDHLCRNKSCCNPDHLEAVTRGENTRRDTAARLHTA